jgi:DNA-binding transcriptional ArsR family regulator
VTVLPGSPRVQIVDETSAARLFKALGDPVRLRVLTLVSGASAGEVCFCDLAEAFDLAQSSLSHHLKILVDAGVLRRQRRGTWSWYAVEDAVLDAVRGLLRPGGPLRGGATVETSGPPSECCG